MSVPIIIIQSNPQAVYDINYDGICTVGSGTPVTFAVVSGISNGISVNYQWYLNDNLVGIGTGYTLISPQDNDRVYVKIVNCGCSCGPDDIDFYFPDITDDVQEHYLDLKASSDYQIQSIVLNSSGTIPFISLSVSGSTVFWSSGPSVTSTTGISEIFAVSGNVVNEGEWVKMTTPGIVGGGTLTGKIKIIRF